MVSLPIKEGNKYVIFYCIGKNMEYIYFITYETLLKNIKSSDNILHSFDVQYILVSNYPKIRYYKIWLWCFFKGILPDKIYLSKKMFKRDLYCLRELVKNTKTDKKILIITDNMTEIDSIRDILNIQYCSFIMFEKYLNETKINKLEPFN